MKKYNKIFYSFIIISLFLMVLSCNSELPKEERKGKWIATCEFGYFAFVIDPTGSMIVFFKDSLKCKSGSHKNSYYFNVNGSPEIDLIDGKISLILYAFANVPAVEVEGKFYNDASNNAFAKGNILMFGRENCATTWIAEKMK